MYLSHTRAADTHRTRRPGRSGGRGGGAGPGRRIPGTVLALGAVSLLTDASAELVTAMLPLYLMYGLGIGYLRLGALDGLYTGATALFRLLGGWAADRLGRPKALAVTGYGLSALTKLALPAAGSSATAIGTLVAADRTGKGIRTGPRDAMIAASVPDGDLGRAFGAHRAMDTCGALIGPLLAFAVLLAVPGGYDTAFLVSFCLAAAGVVVLVCFVRPDPAPGTPAPAAPGPAPLRVRLFAEALSRDVRRCVLAAGLLGLATVGDMFFFLAVQQRAELPVRALPLLPLGTALVFMAAAAPLGRLADRIGRWRLFLGGHAVLLTAYLLMPAAPTGWLPPVLALGLHGLFYAATDGVLMAHVAPAIPAGARATGLAAVQTAQALARAGGAVAFGGLCAVVGLGTAFTLYAALLAAAVAVSAHLGPRRTAP
ncbi:MFS transporter [Streptomyces sp. NPDC006995]|uniref:MFS transporter n=1 Tax=Streptomyces sp. NPDC006995 TaxID=3156907 RepID=UPI0033E32C91